MVATCVGALVCNKSSCVYTLATASKSPGAERTKKSDSSDDGMYLRSYMHIRVETGIASLTWMTH